MWFVVVSIDSIEADSPLRKSIDMSMDRYLGTNRILKNNHGSYYIWGTVDVMWFELTPCFTSTKKTAKVVHLPFDPSFVTVSGEATDAEYLKKTTQDDIARFFFLSRKPGWRMFFSPCFFRPPNLCSLIGRLWVKGEVMIFHTSGLESRFAKRISVPPSLVTWFNIYIYICISNMESLEHRSMCWQAVKSWHLLKCWGTISTKDWNLCVGVLFCHFWNRNGPILESKFWWF